MMSLIKINVFLPPRGEWIISNDCIDIYVCPAACAIKLGISNLLSQQCWRFACLCWRLDSKMKS
jgi:hypothetical protein